MISVQVRTFPDSVGGPVISGPHQGNGRAKSVRILIWFMIASSQVRSGQIRSGSGQVRSGQIRLGQVRSGSARSGSDPVAIGAPLSRGISPPPERLREHNQPSRL